MKRIAIYPKDIMIITGKSERSAREILKKIKTHYRKDKHQIVTVDEFCNFMGIKHSEFEHKINI
jgi:hypothetical protein